MANLDPFLAGGGFEPRTLSGVKNVASGASGNVITLTPAAGQRIRLDVLQLYSGGNGTTLSESGISVSGSIHGNRIGPLVLSNNGATADSFQIGTNPSYTGTARPGMNVHPPIVFDFDEVVTVSKDTGTTGQTIYYAFTEGL